MDSLTHIALGACMGEAFAGKKLGRKAMLWGALAQSAPDIDFLAAVWSDPAANLLAHRGFTHSLLFCALLTPLLALSAERWHRPHNISLGKWLQFFGAVIFTHVLIDAFNNYGVGWFEPFSNIRISFNAIYVADPLFSVWSAGACVALLLLGSKSRFRRAWWLAGLGLSGAYLVYCLANKIQVDKTVRQQLVRQGIPHKRYFTTPAPLQNWLWFVVAGDDRGYYTGYYSVFDKGDSLALNYFPRNDSLLQPLMSSQEVHQLIRFSRGFYTVEDWQDTLVFNDLRFGQEAGWADPRGHFAFHFYLKPAADNTLVVQRGRFANWNRRTARIMWQRIKGLK